MTRLLSLLSFFIGSHSWAAGLPAGVILKSEPSTVQDCQKLLERRLDHGLFEKWASLPAALSAVSKATILVRLSLQKAMPTVSFAAALTAPAPGLTIPD